MLPSKHGCFILQDSAVDVFKTIVGKSGLKAIMKSCYLGSTPSILCEFSQHETNRVKEASELSEKLAAQQACWQRQETSWNWRSLYHEENSASSLKENESWHWKAVGGDWWVGIWSSPGWSRRDIGRKGLGRKLRVSAGMCPFCLWKPPPCFQ